MSVFVLKRGAAERPSVVTVDITGDALSYDNFYVIVDGVKYTSATAGIETEVGKTIVFVIYGTSSYPGSLNVDGVEVVRYTDKLFNEYAWVIPAGVTTISINYTFGLSIIGNTIITVTTS